MVARLVTAITPRTFMHPYSRLAFYLLKRSGYLLFHPSYNPRVRHIGRAALRVLERLDSSVAATMDNIRQDRFPKAYETYWNTTREEWRCSPSLSQHEVLQLHANERPTRSLSEPRA